MFALFFLRYNTERFYDNNELWNSFETSVEVKSLEAVKENTKEIELTE